MNEKPPPPTILGSLQNPAVVGFSLAWLTSLGYLFGCGRASSALPLLAVLPCVLLLCWLTIRITRPTVASNSVAPTEAGDAAGIKTRDTAIWPQLAFLVVWILATGYEGIGFHWRQANFVHIPGYVGLRQILEQTSADWFGLPFVFANPVLYFVIPFSTLLLLGAKPSELGFARGRYTLRVTLLWCAIPLIAIVVFLCLGQLTFRVLGQRLLSNFFQNGPMEEFLFRGALQTRLRKFSGSTAAIVVQAIAFGVWHLGMQWSSTGFSDLWAGLALTIALQTVVGLGFGVIADRTNNIYAASIFHVVSNASGG